MSRYAIVVVIEARRPEEAWEKARRSLGAPEEVSYVGAPWNVPAASEEPVEFGTDSICLTLDGRCVDLEPAD